jgi:hypothetical protein
MPRRLSRGYPNRGNKYVMSRSSCTWNGYATTRRIFYDEKISFIILFHTKRGTMESSTVPLYRYNTNYFNFPEAYPLALSLIFLHLYHLAQYSLDTLCYLKTLLL